MRTIENDENAWIGDIPDKWSLERLKFHACFNPETVAPAYSDDDQVSFIPMDHLKSGFHSQIMVPFSKVKKGYVSFAEDDILMAKVTPCMENGNLAIATGLIDGIGFGSTEINVIRCQTINNKYLFYLLQCPSYIDKATYNMFGVAGLKRLNPEFIPNSVFPLPSPYEQSKIISFLDEKCKHIDSLITVKEKTNALLKEHRQSIIYEAVTKGLSPDIPMKDSGIKWIGQIPEKWNTVCLKRLGMASTGSTPSKDHPEYWDGDIPWVSPKDMKTDYLADSEDHITEAAVSECGLTVFDENTLLFCVRSGILRHTFPVCVTKQRVTINQDLRAMTLTKNVLPSYLLYYLRGINDVIVTLYQKVGATVESIEMDWFIYLPVVLPSIIEQAEIANYLKEQCERIDAIILKNNETIAKLKEYRQSLIYEAVTGKIEV